MHACHEELLALRLGEAQQGEVLPLSQLSSAAAPGFHLAGAHVCPLPYRAAFLGWCLLVRRKHLQTLTGVEVFRFWALSSQVVVVGQGGRRTT